MKNYLDNPKSYEPLFFGKVDTVYTDYSDIRDSIYRIYHEAKKDYELFINYKKDKLNNLAKLYEADGINGEKTMERLKGYADSVESSFIPTPICTEVFHEFRAENKFGAIVKESHLFRIGLNEKWVRVYF